MERCVYKHIYNNLLDSDILTARQSGFIKGVSAVNQLINITNDFGKALDSGKGWLLMGQTLITGYR